MSTRTPWPAGQLRVLNLKPLEIPAAAFEQRGAPGASLDVFALGPRSDWQGGGLDKLLAAFVAGDVERHHERFFKSRYDCAVLPHKHEVEMDGRLHHVEVNVSNLARSRQLWDWLLADLGYVQYQQWEQGVSWKLEGTYIVFVQTAPAYMDPPYHRRRTGLNHLAFHARSRRHVDDLAEELERRGVPILYRDTHPYAGGPEHYAVFFEDPDRIKVELVAPDPDGESNP